MSENKNERPRALLVSIKTPDVSDEEARASLEELERLVTTLGFRVIARESQRQPSTHGATAVGQGKLNELAFRTGAKWLKEVPPPEETATVAIFDCDLRPSQLRHIEAALGVEVLDRTGVIIEIFSRHAKTRAARLQVEIARLNYLSPRLREVGSSGERQSGRGSGESALETERRAIRDRLAELKRELALVQRDESNQRASRANAMCVALVGYTNAGKSSTMRALTGSDVLVEDKLFATLDTTVRALKPETQPRILVSDTVGFIKKLPHDLVASFRSTLDEALNASLLLYVVDAADPTFRSQVQVVDEALREVGVNKTPQMLVLNKADLLTPLEQKRLLREFPGAVMISAQRSDDTAGLREKITEFFESQMVEETLVVPYGLERILAELKANTRVLKEEFENEAMRFTVKATPTELARLRKRYGL